MDGNRMRPKKEYSFYIMARFGVVLWVFVSSSVFPRVLLYGFGFYGRLFVPSAI